MGINFYHLQIPFFIFLKEMLPSGEKKSLKPYFITKDTVHWKLYY